MNLPNKLTLLRFLLVPVFMLFVEISDLMSATVTYEGYVETTAPYLIIALAVFAIASFTDFLDGYLARRDNLVTDFGKFMDPLADKVLTTAAIIYLIKFDFCSNIVLILILTREFAVSGIRMIAASSAGGGKVIAASMWGKVKTVMQMVTVIFAFLALGLCEMGIISVVTAMGTVKLVINLAMWAVAVATVVSGMQYIMPNIDLIKNAK